ncbi:MAG: peptide deformylase [Spirochaetales bacterium]
MALRKIVFDTDPQIRKKSKPVTEFDENLHELLDDMKETMQKADGVGLAAIQVGILKRVVIVEVNNMFLELVNPEIVSSEGEQQNIEGCLSIQNCSGLVKRPATISVKALDRFGNNFMIVGTDYLAVALSHEIDHLDGILYTDKAIEIYREGKKQE